MTDEVADATDNIARRLNCAKAEGMRDAAILLEKSGLLSQVQFMSMADLIDEAASKLEATP